MSLSRAVTLAVLSTSVSAQQHFPSHVELGELEPPNGTRIQGIDELGAAAAPDLDGDGIDDFVLAAPLSHRAFSFGGSLYVLFGPLDETYALDPEAEFPTRGLRIDGLESHDRLGAHLGRAGDLNSDGIEDICFSTDDRSIVLFGGPHLRMVTSVDISQLDGTTGFRMDAVVEPLAKRVYAPIGDVNADGHEDLFVGFPREPSPWTTIGLRNDVRSSDSGDLDGDGDVDLVVAEGDWNSIALLANQGDGTFASPTRLSVALNRDVRLIDLDSDGDLDLVAEYVKFLPSSLVEGWFAVLLNAGDGTFPSRSDYLVGGLGRGVELALDDLDSDGDPDLVGVSFPAETSADQPLCDLRTYRNDGAGAFTEIAYAQISVMADEIELVDATGDSVPDILLASSTYSGPDMPAIYVFRNDGNSFFLPAGRVDLPFFAREILVGDLTGDGRDDVLAQTLLFPGTPLGLGPPIQQSYPRGAEPRGELGDVDGDGTLDVVLEDPDDGFQVHRSAVNGVFARHFRYTFGAIEGRPSLGDLDGDGSLDVIMAERDAISLAFNRGDGSFPGITSGRAFVVFGGPSVGSGGVLDLESLGGTGGFAIPAAEAGANVGNSASAAGDMNDDGVDDFLFTAPFSDGDRGDAYVVYGAPGLGAGGELDPADLTPATGIRIHGIEAEGFCRSALAGLDANGDGLEDLVFGAPSAAVNGSPESGRVRVIFGSPALVAAGMFDLASLDGTNGYVIEGEDGTTIGDAAIRLGELDGDGKDDFAMGATGDDSRGENKGAVYVLFGDPVRAGASLSIRDLRGRAGMALHAELRRSFAGRDLATGDWNHDGRPDLYIPTPPYLPGGPNPGSVHLVWGYDLPKYRRREM